MLGTLGTAAALAILFAAPVRTTLGRSAVTIGAIVIVTLFCWVLRPAAPTVVWLYALVIPALGLTLGPLYGAVAGAFSAPALHWIETGVAVDIIDPQTPFGILILVALGSAPGYFLKIARERRGEIQAQLATVEGLLVETERAQVAESDARHRAVFMLARAAEARDGTTGIHIHEVRTLAGELAEAVGLGADEAARGLRQSRGPVRRSTGTSSKGNPCSSA